MTTPYSQWIRKIGLFVVKDRDTSAPADIAVDLSEFHIKFEIQNTDLETPNSAVIRIYNMSKDTLKRIRGEFSTVILNAGYENGNYGVIFRGTIKQYRIGRENGTDTYLDIFAADDDVFYTQGLVNTSLSKGSTPVEAMKAAVGEAGVDFGALSITKQNVPSIRGVVLAGMARARLRNMVTYLDAGWTIEDGKIVVTDNSGYRDGEAIVLNSATGLIGLPQQTDGGITVRCLLNSRIRIGGQVVLNNSEIIKLMQADPNAAPIAYNQWSGFQFVAGLNGDPEGEGSYRAFSVEHEGDTRGTPWYTKLICLSINETVPKNESVDPN